MVLPAGSNILFYGFFQLVGSTGWFYWLVQITDSTVWLEVLVRFIEPFSRFYRCIQL
jgi:hypothetical protein